MMIMIIIITSIDKGLLVWQTTKVLMTTDIIFNLPEVIASETGLSVGAYKKMKVSILFVRNMQTFAFD